MEHLRVTDHRGVVAQAHEDGVPGADLALLQADQRVEEQGIDIDEDDAQDGGGDEDVGRVAVQPSGGQPPHPHLRSTARRPSARVAPGSTSLACGGSSRTASASIVRSAFDGIHGRADPGGLRGPTGTASAHLGEHRLRRDQLDLHLPGQGSLPDAPRPGRGPVSRPEPQRAHQRQRPVGAGAGVDERLPGSARRHPRLRLGLSSTGSTTRSPGWASGRWWSWASSRGTWCPTAIHADGLGAATSATRSTRRTACGSIRRGTTGAGRSCAPGSWTMSSGASVAGRWSSGTSRSGTSRTSPTTGRVASTTTAASTTMRRPASPAPCRPLASGGRRSRGPPTRPPRQFLRQFLAHCVVGSELGDRRHRDTPRLRVLPHEGCALSPPAYLQLAAADRARGAFDGPHGRATSGRDSR